MSGLMLESYLDKKNIAIDAFKGQTAEQRGNMRYTTLMPNDQAYAVAGALCEVADECNTGTFFFYILQK